MTVNRVIGNKISELTDAIVKGSIIVFENDKVLSVDLRVVNEVNISKVF